MTQHRFWFGFDLLAVVPRSYHGVLGAGIVALVGLSSLLFHLLHLLRPYEGPISFLFGIIVPTLLASLLLAGGVLLYRTEYADLALLIGLWCLVGIGLLTGISLVTIEYQIARGVDLENIPFVISGTGTGGAVVGFLIGVYDAERRRTERRLAAEREKAERLGKRLSVLNRVLRHDIRNDVNVIHGNADRVIQGADAEAAARTIKAKAAKLHRMSESARQIEALLEQDRFPTETIDVATLVGRKARSLEREEIEIETAIPESAWASVNPMIESAVEHVIENAIRHNDADVPRVEVTVTTQSEYVVVAVADNGPGLPAEEVTVLERGHETDLEHASGLGLWLVNWIVTESGGALEFRGNEPRGSVVTIRLPRTDAPS